MRAIAVVLALGILAMHPAMAGADPTTAAIAPPICKVDEAAPPVYKKLVWKDPDGTEHTGYWYTQEQVLVINNRIEHLEEAVAKKNVDAQIEANIPKSVWFIGGALVGIGATYLTMRITK